jgi:hypothetical protein
MRCLPRGTYYMSFSKRNLEINRVFCEYDAVRILSINPALRNCISYTRIDFYVAKIFFHAISNSIPLSF